LFIPGARHPYQEVIDMSEPTTANDRLRALEKEHQDLKSAVRRLERRAYLTPPEQREMSSLKKQKLQAKDQIAYLKRDL
jgi:uncharacterized protein YdcH (DUF465 family)